jgi:hypothetical protein
MDKTGSSDGREGVDSQPRQTLRNKDSATSGAESGLPVLGIVEPLSLEAGGAGKRDYQKVGWGEFEPADQARSVDFVRYLFLEAIREMERAETPWRPGSRKLEVLRELGGAPLAEFGKVKPSKRQLRRLIANPYSAYEANLLTLQKAVEDWARRWHLDAPWCLSTAYATLRLWSDYPKALDLLLWDNNFPVDASTSVLPREVADTAPFPGLPPFLAHIELRSTYIRRIKDRIKRQLEAAPLTAKVGWKLQRVILSADMNEVKAYCDRVMSMYEGQRDRQGMPIWKRVRERAALKRDIKWTVEFQVRGRSFRTIALDEEMEKISGGSIQGLPHTTVSRSVNFILGLIDLPRRLKTK